MVDYLYLNLEGITELFEIGEPEPSESVFPLNYDPADLAGNDHVQELVELTTILINSAGYLLHDQIIILLIVSVLHDPEFLSIHVLPLFLRGARQLPGLHNPEPVRVYYLFFKDVNARSIKFPILE